MHPKTTYTEEEAERVVSAVKAFMADLISVTPHRRLSPRKAKDTTKNDT